MKTRHGFVSNSSSSSFVLVKSNLDEYGIEAMRNFMKAHNADCEEGYVSETRSAFFGDIYHHTEAVIPEAASQFIEYGN